MILPKVRDLRLVTIRRGGSLTDADHRLLAIWAAQELFGPDSGCYKVSANQQAGILSLRFDFPDTAQRRYGHQLAELARSTGWQVQIHPQAHQGALAEAARAALPPKLQMVGAPSLLAATRAVTVRCRGEADPEELEAAQTAFANQTGWRLIIRRE